MITLPVQLDHKTYNITIGRNILDTIGEWLKPLYKGFKISVVTDSNVSLLYSDRVKKSLESAGYEVDFIVLEAGESSKSMISLLTVYNRLLDFGINRGCLIAALGGGVIGDLTGFAASTYLRGVPFIQIPTTLLSQVDSSVGGKVAVNLERGKNLVGSFYHPEAVFIDTEVLLTLSERFFADGMAEVIKYGAIKDRELFQKLLSYKSKEELLENIESIIYTCCLIKKLVVEADERDTGERMLLNFGHTIGHAVENYFNYESFTHGEGVSIGMYAITSFSEKSGMTAAGTGARLKELIIKYNLPWEMPEVDYSKLLNIIGLDKKNTGKLLNLILLKDIGESFVYKIRPEELESYI